MPSVYVLWQFPHILPHLLTYSEVSPKVTPAAVLSMELSTHALLSYAHAGTALAAASQ